MTPASLAKIGRALYGDRWQSELARALDVEDRTVRYWVSSQRAIPEGVEPTLRVLCLARVAELERVVDTLPVQDGKCLVGAGPASMA
jgi:hypothetical protein